MVSRKSHQREPTLSLIVEYCSDLGRRPVALRPIRPYQIVIHGPILPNSGTTRPTGLPDGYIGSMGQVDRGGLEPTDHGLDLNTDVLGKRLRAEAGPLELQDESVDLGLVASAATSDVMHPQRSPGSNRIWNHGVHRTLTAYNHAKTTCENFNNP